MRKARLNAATGLAQLAFVIVPLLSCAMGPQVSMHPLGRSVAIDHFGAGEVPAATIQGCGGETLSWYLVNLATGEQVQSGTEYVSRGHMLTIQFPNLASGSYNVTFAVHGSAVAAANFSVRR